MTPPETVRAYVTTWESDENDHLNVQFYFRHFEDAAAQFFAQAGVPAQAWPVPAARHVRYHRELRVDQSIVGHSHGVAGEPGRLVHVIRNTADGEIAATALDTYETLSDRARAALEGTVAEMPAEAAPRSVDASPKRCDGAAETFEGGFDTYRGRFRPDDCDRHGRPYDRAIVARVSDAATQFWTGIGVTPAWLEQRDSGRVAVEMKLNRGTGGGPDRLVHVQSRLVAVSRSTVSFEHLFVASETGEVVALVEATALTMNLTTRRANRFEDEDRARFEALVRAGRMKGAI